MSVIDISTIKENDVVKFITQNKTLFDGIIKKISNNYLGIKIDIKQKTFERLNKNQIIKIILVHEHQAIKCSSVILGCNQSNFEQTIIISIPEVILGIERREFARLPIVMDMEYSPLPLQGNYQSLNSVEAKYFRSFKKTYTVDISGGGIYFIISKSEIESRFAIVSLSLRNEKIITLCEKIRTDNISDPKHNRVAFKYKDINSQHRQLILDFISEKSKENNNV